MAISDRIAVMKDGVIHHCGKPENIYQRPADVFVASFIGKTNLVSGHMAQEDGQAYITFCSGYRLPFHTIRPEAVGNKEVILSIRPEEFKVQHAGDGVEGEEVEIIQESEINSIIKPGSPIVLSINAGKVNVFDKETTLSLMQGVQNSVALPEVPS